MSKRRLYFQFVAEFIVGGGLLGLGLGILYLFIWILGFYGPFGILFNILVGMVLGLLNGLRLGYLKFYRPISDKTQYQRRMARNAIVVTFVVSLILYTAIVFLAARTIPGAAFYAFLPTLVATFIAWYASAKTSHWQPDNVQTEAQSL